jgi:hypothetical protein
VSAAPRAENFGALAKQGTVLTLNDGSFFAGVKTRPPTSGVELLLTSKENLTAATATKHSVTINVKQ